MSVSIPPDWGAHDLRIEVGAALRFLHLVAEAVPQAKITFVARTTQAIGVTLTGCFSAIQVRGGLWSAQAVEATVDRLHLIDASFDGGLSFDSVVLEGTVKAGLRATTVSLSGVGDDPVELKGWIAVKGAVTWAGGNARVLRVHGSMTAESVTQLQGIILEVSSSLSVTGGNALRAPANAVLKVAGPGSLSVEQSASIQHVEFVDPPVAVQLLGKATATEVHGTVALSQAGPETRLSGTPTEPIRLVGLGQDARGEIQNVDLAGLAIPDIRNLKECAAVTPWNHRLRLLGEANEWREASDRPERTAGWKEAIAWRWRAVADRCKRAIVLREGDREKAERIAERWRQVSRAIGHLPVSGTAQSRIRYAEYHWRRKAIPWIPGHLREKALILGYWVLGYGERMLRPVGAFAAVAALAAWASDDTAFMGPQVGQGVPTPVTSGWFDRFEYLVSSPLSVLSVRTAPVVTEELWIAFVRLFGGLCIALFFLVARRLSRAD